MDFQRFLDEFGYRPDKESIIRISHSYYLIDRGLSETIGSSKEKPRSAGIFLGTEKNKRFLPSIALLNLISEKTDRKIFLDSKAEWLFLCKRDIMGQSVLRGKETKGLVLVQDKNDNNLGMADIISNKKEKDKVYAKNIIDLGDFLRREK